MPSPTLPTHPPFSVNRLEVVLSVFILVLAGRGCCSLPSEVVPAEKRKSFLFVFCHMMIMKYHEYHEAFKLNRHNVSKLTE